SEEIGEPGDEREDRVTSPLSVSTSFGAPRDQRLVYRLELSEVQQREPSTVCASAPPSSATRLGISPARPVHIRATSRAIAAECIGSSSPDASQAPADIMLRTPS